IMVIGASGWAELAKAMLAERRGVALAAAAGAAGLMLIATVPPVADEYDFYINEDGNRVDFDQRRIAELIPEDAAVYIYDDDFARPLSYRMELGGTFYERRVSESGRLRSRLDDFGRSAVTPG